MRIGFSTIYSWRPHVEHAYFLALLARKAGHETYFLTCDGDLPTCYSRELHGHSAWRECMACQAGGIRSYSAHHVTSIGKYARKGHTASAVPENWAYSSASTLGRFESDTDYTSTDFKNIASRLYPVVQITYEAARSWIEDNKLDAVCIFNGRMDATRAIFEAARAAGVRVVSLERTWFGDGLQLYPEENCLGLSSVNRLVAEWKDLPLTKEQAERAASHIAARFLRSNTKEWRAYNTNAKAVAWPIDQSRRKILLIPSSRNEVWGHPDWAPQWDDPTVAYDALMAHLQLEPCDLVLRCHPNWGENIGKRSGGLAERHYTEWAHRKGILCIPSKDTSSTLSLIEQCDAIVVANGSAAMEAGFLGKQIIGIAPSIYQTAGIRDLAGSPAELESLRLQVDMDTQEQQRRARLIARQTLRFCYTMIYRIPQYIRYVKANKTTSFRYDFGASPNRFIELLQTGQLQADDVEFAQDSEGENEILNLIQERNWKALRASPDNSEIDQLKPLRRRLLYRPVDLLSEIKPVGDR